MDSIFSFYMHMTAWQWMSVGIAFLALELMLPGIFMLWFGISGLLTSGLVYLLGFSGAYAIIIFLALGVLVSIFGYKYQKQTAQLVNNPQNKMIGKIITLQEPILNNHARAKIGDSYWTLSGPDAPTGSKVKITQISGNVLIVELV